MNTQRCSRRRAGFTLVEVAISLTILLILAAGIVEAVHHAGALARGGGAQGRIQMAAQDALSRITEDLTASGFVTTGGKTYPFLFDGGNAGGAFAAHDHAPAAQSAEPGDDDFGASREIVFVRPAFVEMAQGADGTNHPLFDDDGTPLAVPGGVVVTKRYQFPAIGADGAAVWDPAEISYVLVTGADGVNELQRRIDGVRSSVVARGVERVTFDTRVTDPVNVPVGAVRIRVWLRLLDEEGVLHRRFVESLVRLQNGG